MPDEYPGHQLAAAAHTRLRDDRLEVSLDGVWRDEQPCHEWQVGATTIAETEVTYSRVDGKEVSLPAVSIWSTREDGLIVDYRVFVDIAPVHAA